MNQKDIKNKEELEVEVQAPKEVQYQCLHTKEEKECTCERGKGLVLLKKLS